MLRILGMPGCSVPIKFALFPHDLTSATGKKRERDPGNFNRAPPGIYEIYCHACCQGLGSGLLLDHYMLGITRGVTENHSRGGYSGVEGGVD